MSVLSEIAEAIGERIRLAGELADAYNRRARGFPGWDEKIKSLQMKLLGVKTVQQPFIPYTSGPSGSFDFEKDRQDKKRVQQGGLDTALIRRIPVSATGPVTGYSPFYCDHNGLQLISRTMDDNGTVEESSDTARVFIRVNNPSAPWLPLGFGFSPQSLSKSDNMVYQGYIDKFWLYVSIATQDPTNQPNLIIALLRSVAIYGPGGGSNLYAPPSTGSEQTPTIGVGSQGGSPGGGGGAAPPVQGGGGAPGGGGSGGGAPGGGGGGRRTLL